MSLRCVLIRQVLERGPMIVPTAKRKSRFLEGAFFPIVLHCTPPLAILSVVSCILTRKTRNRESNHGQKNSVSRTVSRAESALGKSLTAAFKSCARAPFKRYLLGPASVVERNEHSDSVHPADLSACKADRIPHGFLWRACLGFGLRSERRAPMPPAGCGLTNNPI